MTARLAPGARRAPEHRHLRDGERPRARGPAARRAARRDHRRAGGAGGLRARRSDPAAGDRRQAKRRRRAGDVRRPAGRCRAARGRRPRVRAVFPAHQPRRGARPRPARDAPGPGHRRAPRRAHGCERPCDDRAPARRSRSCGSTPCSPRTPPRRDAGRSSSRCGGLRGLLERLDDPRLPPSSDRDIRRQLREEIAMLWRTAELRRGTPTPIDEVRTAMVVFDETHLPPRAAAVRARRHVAARRAQPARAGAGSSLSCPRSSGSARGSGPIATATRRSPRRSPRRRSGSTPTTSCAATRPSPRGSRRPWP